MEKFCKTTLFVCCLLFAIIGCKGMKDTYVTGEVFNSLYTNQWTVGDYWKYRGVRKGKHYLDHYVIPSEGSVPVRMQSVCTPIDELPENYPLTVQTELYEGNMEEIDNMLDNWATSKE
jgi:hypothetical protein